MTWRPALRRRPALVAYRVLRAWQVLRCRRIAFTPAQLDDIHARAKQLGREEAELDR